MVVHPTEYLQYRTVWGLGKSELSILASIRPIHKTRDTQIALINTLVSSLMYRTGVCVEGLVEVEEMCRHKGWCVLSVCVCVCACVHRS